MKIYRQGALLSIICSFVGLILIGCAEEKQGVETGIHKIVIQQSGDTDSFEVSVSTIAANTAIFVPSVVFSVMALLYHAVF